MKFLARRIAHAALLLAAISLVSFALLEAAPGDFFDAMRMNPQISAQTIDHFRAEYGMDRPLPVRYARWVESALRGEMGRSLAYNSAVWPLLAVRARNTLILSAAAAGLAWLLAIPLGVWFAARRGSWGDRAGSIATSTLLTVPELLVFLGLLWLAVRTGWFSTGGMTSLGAEQMSWWQRIKDVAEHLALPALGLALVTLPVLVRHVRSAMIDALDAPFIRAAHAHGIPNARVLYRHALPVAANPLISLFGLSVATMLSSSLLTEIILSWPGMGPLLLEAILARDAYVVMGAVMVSSVLLVGGNLLADILVFASDPRIRAERS
jgi:peptide/nickel transport system permease protein